MKFTHTPGPWTAHKCPIVGGKYGFVIQNKRHRGISIGTLFPGISSDRIEEICEANARLIAEAPDMLEALRAIVLSSNAFEHAEAIEAAEKIIARID